MATKFVASLDAWQNMPWDTRMSLSRTGAYKVITSNGEDKVFGAESQAKQYAYSICRYCGDEATVYRARPMGPKHITWDAYLNYFGGTYNNQPPCPRSGVRIGNEDDND